MSPKRRAHGEGTIRKRADGRWEARLSLGVGPDGKRRYWTGYAKTQAQARELLDAAKRNRQTQQLVVGRKPTVAEFITTWLDEHIKIVRRPKTYESYKYLADVHVIPAIGKHRLDKLTPQHVQSLLNAKRATLAANTVRRMHALIRGALNQAIRWRVMGGPNVALDAELPTGDAAETTPLSATEAQRLLDAVKGHRLEALYTVALAIGLRPGEALGLRWRDVDFATATLQIQVQLQQVGGEWRLLPLKSERSRRLVELPAFAIAALRAHQQRQQSERERAGGRWQDWGLVFTTRDGKPLSRRNVVRQFKAFLAQAEVPERRLYDLRHTCASLLIAQGLHPRKIMDLLGHSTYRLTMDTYGHIYRDGKREAADQMDRLFGGTESARWSDAGQTNGKIAEHSSETQNIGDSKSGNPDM